MSQYLAPGAQLRQTWFRTGYAAEEVEPFVAAVKAALLSGNPLLGSADVAWHRFTPVVLKHGYRMDDVDDYLEDAERMLRERETLR
jgi:DivIVA domain-containing protein